MHKINHWAAYLAASAKAHNGRPRLAKRKPVTTDMTRICTIYFWSFAATAAGVICLLAFGN